MPDLGPNMWMLVVNAMSNDAIPKGGGIASGVEYLCGPERVKDSFKNACQFAREAVDTVRGAKGVNPFRNATDEDIAGEILRRLDELRRARRNV